MYYSLQRYVLELLQIKINICPFIFYRVSIYPCNYIILKQMKNQHHDKSIVIRFQFILVIRVFLSSFRLILLITVFLSGLNLPCNSSILKQIQSNPPNYSIFIRFQFILVITVFLSRFRLILLITLFLSQSYSEIIANFLLCT